MELAATIDKSHPPPPRKGAAPPNPARHREELALVERMLAGDRQAMEAFGDVYFPSLYRFALSRLGNRELTRDLVQKTVCRALSKLASYRGEAALYTWLCACCRNEIRMHFRQARRAREEELDEESPTLLDRPFAGEPGPEGQAIGRQERELVHLVLDRLPSHYSAALEWKYLEQLPVAEIASRLELGLKAAESLLTRARSAFRDDYEHLTQSERRPSATLTTDLRP